MTKVLLKKKLQVSIEVAGMMVPHPHKLERVICWKILLMMWAKDEKKCSLWAISYINEVYQPYMRLVSSVLPYHRRKKPMKTEREGATRFQNRASKGEEEKRRKWLEKRSCNWVIEIHPQGCEGSDQHYWYLQSVVPPFFGEIFLRDRTGDQRGGWMGAANSI